MNETTYWCSATACPFFSTCPKSVLCAPEGVAVLHCCDLRCAEGCYSLRLQGEYLARMTAQCVPLPKAPADSVRELQQAAPNLTAGQERSDGHGNHPTEIVSPCGQASSGR